jgi:hypothetical protein
MDISTHEIHAGLEDGGCIVTHTEAIRVYVTALVLVVLSHRVHHTDDRGVPCWTCSTFDDSIGLIVIVARCSL